MKVSPDTALHAWQKSVYTQGSAVLIKYMHALYTSRKSLICDLSAYGLTEWPEFVGVKAHTLEKIYLKDNNIPAIPSSMKILTSLKTLDVSNNKIGTLPVECAKNWRNLSWLEMRANTLFMLPNEVEQLYSLSYLGVKQNQLEYLPDTLCNNSRLKRLHVDENKLQVISKDLSQLSLLEQFTMEKNNLDILPVDIGLCENLAVLKVEDNPWRSPPPEIMKMPGKEILLYLRRFLKARTTHKLNFDDYNLVNFPPEILNVPPHSKTCAFLTIGSRMCLMPLANSRICAPTTSRATRWALLLRGRCRQRLANANTSRNCI